MEKNRYYERKAKRDSGLGTIDATWKMMIDVYWAKVEGREYKVDQLCAKHQVGKYKTSMIDEAVTTAKMPTREDADALRISKLKYEEENYKKKDAQPAEEQTESAEQMAFGFDYGEGLDNTAMFVLNGHTYKIIQID